MAATVRSEAYNGLVRRIGYSVGLEYLTARVAELAEVYVGKGSVDGADWRDLVQRWGRLPSAEPHIADVYAQLELIRRHRSTIQPLPALDVLSIILSGFNPLCPEAEDGGLDAVRFILLFKVLEADGDIFLNALATGFRPVELGLALKEMIRHKRRAVRPLFKQAGSIRRIMEAISIRNQAGTTSSGKRQTYAERSRQLMSLEGSVTTRHPEDWADQEVAISDDYLEKACVTRRAWAEDFGLYTRDSEALTQRGVALLNGLVSLELAFLNGSEQRFAFWPYGFALRSVGIIPEEIGVPDLSSWDILQCIAGIWSPIHGKVCTITESSRQELIGLLRCVQERYQHTNRRGVIRHDLPIFIAEPVLAFWIMQCGGGRIDMRAFLREELHRPDRKIDLVMIRGTEGGLRLMGESDGYSA